MTINRIALVGIGGGGSNSLNSMIKNHDGLVSSLVIDRDGESLKASMASVKVHLDNDSPKASILLGIGSKEKVVQAIKDKESTFMQFINGKCSLILFAGMGGFTGSYVTPSIASVAVNMGIHVKAFITMPFSFEGQDRIKRAIEGERQLIDTGADVQSFHNQDLFKTALPETSMLDAFRFTDKKVFKLIEPLLV